MRPTWEQYFMNIAKTTAQRSSCLSEQKGAVIVKNKRIIGTGYSGAPSGISTCLEQGECRKRHLGYGHGEGHHECKAVHAEANAILSAAKMGISTNDSVLYCTHKPCENCIKLIINSGIKTIYYEKEYESNLADVLIKESNIEIIKL